MSRTLLKHACLLATIAAPGIALADEPAPQAQSLAAMETILEHCAKLNPAAADKYREQGKQLAQGASEETLANIRKSDEYQQSRDSTLESLAKSDDETARKACAQTVAPTE
jgi:chaperonin cofactor prefoldin